MEYVIGLWMIALLLAKLLLYWMVFSTWSIIVLIMVWF